VVRLPSAELERAGEQDNHTDRYWNGARQLWQVHLDRRQRDIQWERRYSKQGPHEELPDAYQRGQQTQACLACPGNSRR
jgi:hypothetical protein